MPVYEVFDDRKHTNDCFRAPRQARRRTLPVRTRQGPGPPSTHPDNRRLQHPSLLSRPAFPMSLKSLQPAFVLPRSPLRILQRPCDHAIQVRLAPSNHSVPFTLNLLHTHLNHSPLIPSRSPFALNRRRTSASDALPVKIGQAYKCVDLQFYFDLGLSIRYYPLASQCRG